MNDTSIKDIPVIHPEIWRRSQEIGFNMPSDIYTGSLLKTLIASKPNGKFLEMGTGTGLALSWMVDGMDRHSKLITVDNDPGLIGIAQEYFNGDPRLEFVCTDGNAWIGDYKGSPFDLVFADAWPGKYSLLEKMLELVKIGGFYVIDDMAEQPNWPTGHGNNVAELISYLEFREDFCITKMNWSTGVILATRKF
ncbi:MAG: methyltransferase domain-containing protein [Sediminicola sp.]|tara:strand:- start:25001 stop:25582 length:582 start_codon:yes stop_codon:yes gene_type:complete